MTGFYDTWLAATQNLMNGGKPETLGGSLNGEESSSGKSVRGSFSANRTTDEWKLSFSASANYRESRFDLGEGEIFNTVSRSFDSTALTVKSLGKHWAGLGSNDFVLAVEGLDGHLGRDLARLRAAHAVGDREQRRARVERVLVGPALAPGVGAVELLGDAEHQSWKRKWESPIRTRSPPWSGCGPRSSSSLR